MTNNPIRQHDIPSAYLRRFSSKKNHVWCLFKHDYEGWKIEEKSVNERFFKYDNIYTLEGAPDPFALEKLFDKELENKYYATIEKIKNKDDIDLEEFGFLALWMYVSKFRNLNVKDDWSKFHKRYLKMKLSLLQNVTKHD